MEKQIEDLLKRNALSLTDSRKKILNLFFSANGALSHGVIEKSMGETMDRVTIYRTLQVFVEKGIIHTIPTNDNSIRYALCKDECESGHHHDHHVHFVCVKCGTTTCLDDVTVPEVRLPKGFKPKLAEMVVSGNCDNCE